MSLENLTPIQIDFLKELTNIGGGNSATALSQMVGKMINMEVPRVQVLPYETLFQNIMKEEEEVHGVSIRVLGDIPGYFLFILQEKHALDLVGMLMGQDVSKHLDAFGVSALKEICNILCSSYLNALSRLLNKSLISSVPGYAKDMFGAILPSVYIEAGQIEEYLLVIESNFLVNQNTIKAHLFFVPNEGSLDKLFSIMDI